MNARPSDFVNVRLSAAGLLFAGKGGTVHVSSGHMAYRFTGTEPQRVLRRGEWLATLSIEQFNGSPIFELVTESAPIVQVNEMVSEPVTPE